MSTRIQKLKEFEIDGFKPFENINVYHIVDFLFSYVNCKICPVIKDQDELGKCDMCFKNLQEWFLEESEKDDI